MADFPQATAVNGDTVGQDPSVQPQVTPSKDVSMTDVLTDQPSVSHDNP